MQYHVYTVFDLFQNFWTSCNNLWLCLFPQAFKFPLEHWLGFFIFKMVVENNDDIQRLTSRWWPNNCNYAFSGISLNKILLAIFSSIENRVCWDIVYNNSVENVPYYICFFFCFFDTISLKICNVRDKLFHAANISIVVSELS